MVAIPVVDVRYDRTLTILGVRYNGTRRWLEFEEKRNFCLCFQCSMLTSDKSGKCQMHLYFQKNRNCFKRFHF